MIEKIICRFAEEKDLKDFNERNGLELTRDTKTYDVHTGEIKTKKRVAKKQKSEAWKEHWIQMPEFIYEDVEPYAKIEFTFNKDDLELAKEMFNQSMTDKTKSVWFPKLIPGSHSKFRVVGGNATHKYPIYVVSKGRSDKCYTSRFLSQMEVDHYVVVEPDEVQAYKELVENEYAKILELDMRYKDEYDTFDDLGDTKGKGPGGARNFCWEHSIANGAEWHWVMDDNATEGFHYLTNNVKNKCRSGAWFRACEDFVDRYENIAQAGLNYTMFCVMGQKYPAFVTNTRIYSFLLIRNDIPYRWRGRYNEDTDLSLRILKDGWCTVQFNAFTAGKATTQKVKGGNMDMFYAQEGTLPKSKMLEDMHPDVAKVVWKFNRWHHQVDYSGFTQELKLKEGIEKDYSTNNYGMVIINTDEESTYDTKSYLEEKYADKIREAKGEPKEEVVEVKETKKKRNWEAAF